MKTSQKTSKSNVLKEIKGSLSEQYPLAEMPNFNSDLFKSLSQKEEQPILREPKRIRRTEIVFNYSEKKEQVELNKQLSEMINQVKKELSLLKKEDKALVDDISKVTMVDLPKNAGVYHLRFLEFIIKLLQSIRLKISEGRLWLQTTFEKKSKKKFWQMAKTKGTKFSMSRELTQANTPG